MQIKTRVKQTTSSKGWWYYEGAVVWINSSCEDSERNCNMPIKFTGVDGKITVDSLNVTYDYNITHAFNSNDTLTWNETTDIIQNQKYKRRYSINPTSDLLSNDLNITGYYLRNWTASECEINNIPRTVASNYCAFADNMAQGNSWNTTYIWDNNVSGGAEGGVAINMTNISYTAQEILRQNDTITYFNPDLTSASSGLFTNATIEYYYNSSIGTNHKLEYYNSSGGWSDITPSVFTYNCVTSPVYERKTADNRVFHVCIDATNKYISYKIETSN